MLPNAAVIFEVPADIPVANPPLLMLATDVVAEVHVT
jgi:hypothetical protein